MRRNMEEKQIDFKLLKQMIDCVKREVKMRYAVYPSRVNAGKMTNDEKEQLTKIYTKLMSEAK